MLEENFLYDVEETVLSGWCVIRGGGGCGIGFRVRERGEGCVCIGT